MIKLICTHYTGYVKPVSVYYLYFPQIANGRPIPIILLGQGTEPCVLFSFTEYDFGPRFLHNSNMPPNEKTLVITNAEREAELR